MNNHGSEDDPTIREPVNDKDSAYARFEEGRTLLEHGEDVSGIQALQRLATEYSSGLDPDVRWCVNQALLTKAAWALMRERFADALEDSELLLRRLYESAEEHQPSTLDVAEREQFARALMHQGQALFKLRRLDESAAQYARLITLFEADDDSEVQAHVAGAFNGRADLLLEAGETVEALVLIDDLVSRYSHEQEPETRAEVARGLFNKAEALTKAGDLEDAIGTFDFLIENFGNDDARSPQRSSAPLEADAKLRERVKWAQVQRGNALRASGRGEEALEAFNQVIERAAPESEPWSDLPNFYAQLYRAAVFDEMDRQDEAIDAYDELLAQFSDVSDPALAEQIRVAKARRHYLVRHPDV